MTNEEVAQALEEIADLLEIADEQFFRIRSYRRAAEAIGAQPEDVEVLLAQDRLTDISGIGEGIAHTIAQLINTGTCEQREELLKDYPESLLELLKISGFGPKKAALVFNELDIATVDELEEAAAAQELQTLPGMGAKTEENILKGIANYRDGQERTLLGTILPVAEELIEQVRQHPSVIEAEIAGSARRRRETVHDLDVLVTAEDPAQVCEWFAGHDFLGEVEAAGETKVSGTLHSGDQVDLRAVPEESFGAALQYFTGSQQHNIRLRERAQRMDLTVNEYGVFEYEDEKRGDRVAGRTEQEVYEALDLVWIPPELREDRGEVSAAESNELPDLIELDDIRCDLQMHSTYSDGKATVEEMARTCAEIGYEYIGLTDHSESLAVANGLD
ncbi:MAG: helix-hairpin-helix domain-containing protein, partial [Armatimonadota bacterium]